ncbi:F-box/kelch-repeat protein At3g23880-like [Lycium ferocissimum]|uniref:F-box/kelch-repeat protein At3g23880-like n=1 Tax=Lycium ferocissimum TaxID=112874 RepID=UPI00281536E3|nr:F-box/kelch-repeat protein At3g23880-like [Lycium ferocissimum]
MNLPEEILVEILSRLPVKSLHRCMCVSNLFSCLICDPHFQNKHLRHAQSCSNLESKRLLANIDFDLRVSCSLFSACYNNTIAWRPNYAASNNNEVRKNFISVVVRCSHVNGLFCVSFGPPLGCFDWFEICLWNPTSNELRRLPNSSSLSHEETEPHYGLGYDSANDDYVVVRLITNRNDMITKKRSIRVELYSLKTDSWTTLIQPFPYTTLCDSRNTYFDCHFVNGRFHWMVLCDKSGYHDFSPVIVSLDLSNYEYKDIPQPNYTKVPNTFVGYGDAIDIVVLDGLLCACCNYFERGSFDLWTMKDYGVQQSWTMMLSISNKDILASVNLSYSYLVPLYLFENGGVLLKTYGTAKHKILVYKKEFKQTLGREIRASNIYTETLISPHRYIGTPASLRIIKLLMGVSRDRLIQYVSY